MYIDITGLIGWAGSGKTKRLIDGILKALPALGNDPHSVGVSSFSRASNRTSVERAAKAIGCPEKHLSEDGWFRTMHSIAYQCTEAKGGELLTGKKEDIEWMSKTLGCELHTSFCPVTGEPIYSTFDPNDVVTIALNLWSLSRSTMRPLHVVAQEAFQSGQVNINMSAIVSVLKQYESAKRIDGRSDFTDLVSRFAGVEHDPEEGVSRVEAEGYVPEIQLWVFDEMQDTSPLLMEVAKRLVAAPSVRKVVLAGDPGQTIHQWNGADPSCFLDFGFTNREFMTKTWRCPKQIVDVGIRALKQIRASSFRYDRDIEAANMDGSVNAAHSLSSLSRCKPGEDWLVLARTNFQANRMRDEFKKLHIPVTATTAQDGGPSRKQVGMKALLDMERGKAVTGEQFAQAIALLPSRDANSDPVVRRGYKSKWKDSNHIGSWEVVFKTELHEAGIDTRGVGYVMSGEWPKLVTGGNDWRDIVDRHGIEHTKTPTIKIGTVHSAKGMEAENVFVLTTSSERIEEAANRSTDRHNEECRISYVAATRAKKSLTVCDEGGYYRMRGLR